LLEEEVLRLKNQLDALMGDLCFMTDKESVIDDLNIKLLKLDAECRMQKTKKIYF